LGGTGGRSRLAVGRTNDAVGLVRSQNDNANTEMVGNARLLAAGLGSASNGVLS
jgi:hypothetical protein